MIEDKAYVPTGTASAMTLNVPTISMESGGWFKVRMGNNSAYGMTVNGKSVKVLDIFATEESQWTISSHTSATKNLAKVEVYRTICENMLSEDVEYKFRYIPLEDAYEVDVSHIYKHCFIPCGFGKEITELQDALSFAAQFTISNSMDSIFVAVQASTEFFPNKAEISIVLPQGTALLPVTSVMTKNIRCGESDLSNVAIYNEGFYTSNAITQACIVEFTSSPSADDIGVMSLWKTDLSEVRYLTIKFHGEFTANNQAVVAYIDSRSKFKNCDIDITAATVAGGVTSVYGFQDGKDGNSNSNTVYCPVLPSSWLTAYSTATGGSSIKITGKPNVAIECTNDSQFFSLDVTDTPEVMFSSTDSFCEITVNSAVAFTSNYLYKDSLGFHGKITLDSSISLSGITNANLLNPAINKIDKKGNSVVNNSLGVIKRSWMPYGTVSPADGATTVTLDDGALTNIYVATGFTVNISQINLSIGDYDLASLGESFAINLYIRKSGSGTLTFTTGGNVLPANSGTPLTISNPNEPTQFLFDPNLAKWCPVI